MDRTEYFKKYRLEHKAEKAEWSKNYAKTHKEQIRKHIRKYQQTHKEEINKKSKLFRDTHKEHIKKYNREYSRKRKNSDIGFKLICNLRTKVSEAIRRNSKSSPTLMLLGCSVNKLKQHLESQFKPNMSWDNYGYYGWHIDHKKPCVNFDLSSPDEQKKCFHYTNLQPLWAEENMRKNRYETAGVN